MKNILLIIAFITLSSNLVSAQTLVDGTPVKHDTIYASTSQMVTMVFPEAVLDFVTPSPNYSIRVVDNIVYIMATSTDPSVSNITIRYATGVYVAYLSYNDTPQEIIYPLHGLDYEVHDKGSHFKFEKSFVVDSLALLEAQLQQQEKKDEDDVIDKRLKYIINAKDEYKTFGIIKDGIQVAITNIINDKDHSYFKIVISNSTGAEYDIDYLYFEFQDRSQGGLFAKNENKPERLIPKRHTNLETIPARSTQIIGYVIDLFSVTNKGRLNLLIGEQNGIRNMKIKINAKDLSKVQTF